MHDLTDLTPFERRLSDRLAAELGGAVRAFDPQAIAAVAIGRQRRFAAPTLPRLLTAAALTAILGGVIAAGSGLISLPPAPTPTGSASSPPATPRPEASPSDALRPARDPGFVAAGSTIDARAEHFAVRLPDGSVLVGAGLGPRFPGSNSSREYWNSTERWLPDTKAWAASASLGTGSDVVSGQITRVDQPAFVLPDGRVLIIPAGCACSPHPLLHAELWSLRDGGATVETLPSLQLARVGHSATLLADGRVLIASGAEGLRAAEATGAAEVWDPIAGTITPSGELGRGRMNAVATLLADGRVLIVGGRRWEGDRELVEVAEIWDPRSGAFSFVDALQGIVGVDGSLSGYRAAGALHAITLASGRVLLLDGTVARLWDPATGALEDAGAFLQARTGYAVAILPSGRVLIVGGSANEEPIAAAELWDPAGPGFSDAGNLLTARDAPTATTLLDGRVLVVGGYGLEPDPLESAELWEPGDAR